MKTITLLAAHHDAGRPHLPGATLTLSDRDADWLIAIGRAQPAASHEPSAPAGADTFPDPENDDAQY